MTPQEVQAAIEDELGRRSPRAFRPGLEALYEQREGRERRAKLALGLRVVGWCTLAAIVNDSLDSLGSIWWILGWRVGMAILAFGGNVMLRRINRQWVETATIAVICVGMIVSNEILGVYGPVRFGDRYVQAAAVCVVGLLVVLPLRVQSGVVAVAASMVASVAALWFWPGHLPLRDNLDMPVFAFGTFMVALLNVALRELRRRTIFLQQLRYELTAEQLTAVNAELLRHSTTDVLTGLANRRRFEAEAKRVWRDRDGQGLGVLLIDVDRFKSFNDTAGHEAGDMCLREVAAAISATLRREDDLAARYGGEEFVVLLPRVKREAALTVGERVRAAVAERRMPHPGLDGAPVTISVGVAWRDATAFDDALQVLLRDADRALYSAKAAGRNCVVASGMVEIAAGA